ncbi:MAG TPA: type II toxin-antitoxin system VapC family toxin [Candidatus Acidoferrales bacterium]
MSGFLIDTNVLSEYNRGGPDAGVKTWIETTPRVLQYVSVITLAEIEKGVGLLEQGKRRTQLEEWLATNLEEWFGGRVLSVDRNVGSCWARLMVAGTQRGNPLPVIDSLIAATALAHDLTIVTRNIKDFASTGVRTINPWKT